MNKIKYYAFNDIYGKGYGAEINLSGMEENKLVEIAKNNLFILLANYIDENQDYDIHFTCTYFRDSVILRLSSSYC